MSVNNAKGSSCMGVKPDEAESESTVQTSNSTVDTPLSSNIPNANINNDAVSEKVQPKHKNDRVKPNRGKKRPDCDIEDSESEEEVTRLSNLTRESIGEKTIVIGSTLRERRAKAPRRLLQAKAYAELVEDRILYLEGELQALTKSKDFEMEEPTEDKNLNAILSLPHVADLGWTEFNHKTLVKPKDITGKWYHRAEVNTDSKPVVEVLVEEPRYSLSLASTNQQNADESHKRLSGPDCGPSTQDRSGEPYRVRIRSRLLLRALKEITGINLVVGPHEHRLLMLRPFKFLVHFEEKIKNFISEAENKELIDENTSMNEERATVKQSPIPRTAGPVTETQSPQALKELKVVRTLIDTRLRDSTELQRGIGPAIRKITFNELWYIFKPGYEIRTPGQSRVQVYRIAKVTGGRDTIAFGKAPENHASKKLKDDGFSEGAFVIECFYIHFDGSRFGPVNTTFQIRKFADARDINTLPVVPFQCCAAKDETRKRLMARGKKFTELSGPGTSAHRKYKGLTLDRNPEQVESEVIIDFELAFLQTKINRPSLGLRDQLVDDDKREVGDVVVMDHVCTEAGCCGNEITFNDYAVDDIERNSFKAEYKYLFDDNPEHPNQLTPEHLILLPPHVYGFVLRTRRWATFDIDRLDEIPANGDGWNNLVIKDDIKRNVLALVKNHERPRGSQAMIDGALSSVDLIPGKGRGLIILLHGEPGVGKTSTAECVAALTGRPLFPITCGDIGDKAETVETNLEKNFQLAHKWGCVLLLDEADIFLSARTAQDIQRNAIVSVFLRTLEYYSGILFLTTNRVGHIDRAFKSRIHLSLLYKKLNRERTIQIWDNNISRIQKEFNDEGKKIDLRRLEILDFAKKHYKELRDSDDLIVWNGRQIRNAFQTAIAIAAYDANNNSSGGVEAVPVVGASQFQMVARSARQFDSYLKQVKTHHDTDLAKMDEERDDDFTSTTDEEESRRPKKRAKRNKKASKKRKRSKHNESSEDSDEDSEKSMNDPEDSSKDSDSDDEKRAWLAGKKKTKY
ncbi:hypothetical protein F5Y19DRAFT_431078 [Xylariaceae sp. FL1651]|nr:hypothetical protein F5Y19DRAFT_431078 [Xylariaceae sp. FL1651]